MADLNLQKGRGIPGPFCIDLPALAGQNHVDCPVFSAMLWAEGELLRFSGNGGLTICKIPHTQAHPFGESNSCGWLAIHKTTS